MPIEISGELLEDPINIEAIKVKEEAKPSPVFNTLSEVYEDVTTGGGRKLSSLFSPEAMKLFNESINAEELGMNFVSVGAGTIKMGSKVLSTIRDIDRNISPKSIEELKSITESIKKEGIKKPVTVTISTKDNMAYITDGNTRVTVAKNLGIENIPVRFEKTDVPFTSGQKSKAKSLSDLGIDIKTIPDKVLTKEQKRDKEELLKLLAE